MKYRVRFNEMYKHNRFIDMTEKDNNGKYIIRDKNSEPWIVDEDRMKELAKHSAIVIIDKIKEEIRLDKDTAIEEQKPTKSKKQKK